MLSRRHRLHKNRDVQRVLRKGARLSGSGVRVSYQTTRRPTARFTVVVSAKTLKRATDRNRIKRQIRAALHQFIIEHHPFGLDVVLTVTKGDAALVMLQTAQLLATIAKKIA